MAAFNNYVIKQGKAAADDEDDTKKARVKSCEIAGCGGAVRKRSRTICALCLQAYIDSDLVLLSDFKIAYVVEQKTSRRAPLKI